VLRLLRAFRETAPLAGGIAKVCALNRLPFTLRGQCRVRRRCFEKQAKVQGNSKSKQRLGQKYIIHNARNHALASQGLTRESRQVIQGPPETAPPQNPLNDASGANRLRHISSIVITNLDIFHLRPLRVLLLRFSRKSFALSQKPSRKFPAQNENQPPPSGFQKP